MPRNWKRRNKVSEKGFVVAKKFQNVHKEHRLTFLVSCLRLDSPDLQLKGHLRRRGFNGSKGWSLPLTDKSECYLCKGKATLRHHVIPLVKGGRNKLNNIVPLCQPCHCRVHPHMQKGYKRPERSVHRQVLGKPLQTIVVIPPKSV